MRYIRENLVKGIDEGAYGTLNGGEIE